MKKKWGQALFGTFLLSGLGWLLPNAHTQAQTITLSGLQAEATVRRDAFDIPHISATNDHDAYLVLGYVQAHDRFFQMDSLRHIGSGTSAELLGAQGLETDVPLRLFGLRRAAEASVALLSAEGLAALEAYVAGINLRLNELRSGAAALPAEYSALELSATSIANWTMVDSLTVVKLLAFSFAFTLPPSEIGNTQALLTFEGAGEGTGFDGTKLFFEDFYRIAPFDPTIVIPDFELLQARTAKPTHYADLPPVIRPNYLDGETLKLVESTLAALDGLAPLGNPNDLVGSNWWVVSGALTTSGFPMLANDPHLNLGTPTTLYPAHLMVTGTNPLNISGAGFPGIPGILVGCNTQVCWGVTVNNIDVTDVYQEELLVDPLLGPTHSTFRGELEPLLPIPQRYSINALNGSVDTVVDSGIGVTDPGGLTLIVPRRNNGPILQVGLPLNLVSGTELTDPTRVRALSVQFAGSGPTTEIDTVVRLARVQTPEDFVDALQFFDVGSLNWSYADIAGNIAYWSSAEMPIREDLQLLGEPDGGILPTLIRDGTGQFMHEWMALENPQPEQHLPFEILPFAEMPQVVNPARGYIISANNDPVGTTLDNNPVNEQRPGGGAYYLSAEYAPGFRAGRIQRLFDGALANEGTLDLNQMIAFQANNQSLDAEVFTPYLLAAFANAQAPNAHPLLQSFLLDPRVIEAITRISRWDFRSPTGIQEGYDPGDDPLNLPLPSEQDIASSIATTLYSLWRTHMLKSVIDFVPTALGELNPALETLSDLVPPDRKAMTALRHVLDNFDRLRGAGESGLYLLLDTQFSGNPFPFNDSATARDYIILQSMQRGLDLLASDTFAPAFANSTDQNDYRWGKLHRITFAHLLGSDPFNIPNGGGLTDLSTELPGLARPGNFEVVDDSDALARAEKPEDFVFSNGPVRRAIAILDPTGPQALEVFPGGTSGNIGSPHQSDQLFLWLVNQYRPLLIDPADVEAATVNIQQFVPEP